MKERKTNEKVLILTLFIIIALLITSCSMDSIELYDNIESPSNINIPISGKYVFPITNQCHEYHG